METKDIQKLIDFIANSGLDEVNIETAELKLKVKRHASAAAAPSPSAESNLITIKSPMIGTFYRASSPETPPLVNVGDEISAGKPLCIIEAMKLFNEIESEVSGRIVKVLVENATPVEFDQPLFLVEPA